MKVVALHHHFERGGVTQVVVGHLTGLAQLPPEKRPEEIWIVHGGRCGGWPGDDFASARFPIPVHQLVVEGLEYDALRGADAACCDGRGLADLVERRLQSAGLRSEHCVLHAHNPTLGKNTSIPGMIRQLSERGWRWLLQIHDFAEEHRPTNYAALISAAEATTPTEFESWLYPQSSTIHYATLASGDAHHLAALGVPGDRLHVIPNPVLPPPENLPDRATARAILDRRLGLRPTAGYVLYPVRGIRRKNLGELLLWAALRGDDYSFSVTLPPATPVERRNWDRWRRLAGELRLPVVFGSGTVDGVSFATNMAAADHVISTSVSEGFGMVFLEPWMMNRPLVGRDLPGVTGDFRAAGLLLHSLYDRLPIALAAPERTAAIQHFRAAFDAAWGTVPPSFRPPAPAPLSVDDSVDFGMLTAEDQASAVCRVVGSRSEAERQKATAADVFAKLASPGAVGSDGSAFPAGAVRGSLLAHNRDVVTRVYAPEGIATRLLAIYQTLLDQPAAGAIEAAAHAGRLFNQISRPRSFRPIGTETSINDSPFVQLARPLQPLPTGYPSRRQRIAGVRAVVFDIYGTLVISGSGDVGSANENSRSEAIAPALRAVGVSVSELPEQDPRAMSRRLHAIILEHQERSRQRGVAYPEVDILAVWQQWLRDAGQADVAARVGLVRRLATEFEARANPSWPMPAATETLRHISAAGLPMGIVSNAQFFTLEMLQSAWGGGPLEVGFDMDLSVFSFRYGHAKPGPKLFDVLVAALTRRGIAPAEAVYVGNDMLNDIAAASHAGLRTVLFAGDRRSLRLREGDSRVSHCTADAVLNDLADLPRLIDVSV